MRTDLEISYDQLIKNSYWGKLRFETTAEIEHCDELVGQERAEASMKFGIGIKEKGYNIYISGKSGSGRLNYARKVLEEAARGCAVPNDWCYVYNFYSDHEPIAISFQPGMGKVFKQDMEYTVNELIDKIPAAFNSEEYDRQKSEILQDYQSIKSSLIDELNEYAQTLNLQVKVTNTGFAFIPIVDGRPMSESEYDSVDGEIKDFIMKNIASMRIKALDILRKLKAYEKDASLKVDTLDREIGNYIVENQMSSLRRKYMGNERALKYFEAVKEDILKNLNVFVNEIDVHSLTKEQEEILMRYKVNLIVDNSDLTGCPVIYEMNPTFSNLYGSIEYESRLGTITTDFLMIRAGSVLRANGRYLIINAKDLLKNYQAWEGLKRVLMSGELRIEGVRSQLDLLSITTIKPQTIHVDIKVILIGAEYLYQLLIEYDEEFSRLFKVKVDFDEDMEKNDQNIEKFAKFLGYYCRQKNIRHLNREAVGELIKYSSRLARSSKRMSTRLERITDLVEESNAWANTFQSAYITGDLIKKSIDEKVKRINQIEEKMLRNYKEKRFIIDTKGKAVGQINGLSVIEIGGYTFGKPCRITASTYMGKGGIINIEREVQMSGNIHSKSVMIISGYLGSRYAANIPLSLTANICFEQLYGYIDGDSASIAELYALLSSLSEIPLKQGIAVTGSLNQMGEVQPVGGINEKVEGFYKVCSLYGLTGEQGVILPHQNVEDLVLDDGIVKAIKDGAFHLYAIKHVEEGVGILTDLPAGRIDGKGGFEEGTFNYYVYEKLKGFIKNFNSLDEMKQ